MQELEVLLGLGLHLFERHFIPVIVSVPVRVECTKQLNKENQAPQVLHLPSRSALNVGNPNLKDSQQYKTNIYWPIRNTIEIAYES